MGQKFSGARGFCASLKTLTTCQHHGAAPTWRSSSQPFAVECSAIPLEEEQRVVPLPFSCSLST